MIYASDFPAGVTAEAHYGGHTQRLVDHGLGEIWECDCEAYQTPKPNTARAFCEHTQQSAAACRGPVSG